MPFIIRKTITETFLERAETSPSEVGYQFKPTFSEWGPIGQWKEVTFKEFYDLCQIVSFGLMGLGVKPTDKVVILSNTRFEWSLSDLAILGAGAITVPIYASNTADDVCYIVNHCEAKVAIVEDSKQLEKILEKRAQKPDFLPLLEKIVVIEPSAMKSTVRFPDFGKNVLTLHALMELGRREEAKDPFRFERNLSSAKPDDLITICYTSGTTGVPKGVMLTHDSLMSVLEDARDVLGRWVLPKGETLLSFLPFSHIFGKVESLAIHVFGWKQAFAESIDLLVNNLGEVKPTLLFAVPRIFEKVYVKIQNHLEQEVPLKKMLFDLAWDAGTRYYTAIWEGQTPSVRDLFEYQVAKNLILSRLTERLGGRLRFAICGGAPFPKSMGQFFQVAGVQILEGYGLTETCAPVTLNTRSHLRFGTVGRPLPEVNIRIAEDGEILVKSRKVFKGYYKMPEETAQAIVDGWFHTGDIGMIDSEGYLHITDRKKDLIVTSAGKNVAPQKIENIAKLQKMISQFVVHGDQRNFLTALLTLDREQIIKYANEHQILFSEYAELIKNPKILALVQTWIDEINKELASYETIKKFVVVPDDFTVETGELTPSLKVRRNFINKKYKAELDGMYAETGRVPLD